MLAVACALSFGLISPAWAVTYTYTNIQFPGSFSTTPRGINNKGEVVGDYQNSSGVFGFLLSNGTYTSINCPGATTGTYATGINDDGVIVGYFTTDLKTIAFTFQKGNCKNLPDFNGSAVNPYDINDAGQIVGAYFVATDVDHGFELTGKTYTDISVPASSQTFAAGISSAGEIVGSYYDASLGEHGFLLRNGTYQTIDIPGATGKTSASGLNDKSFIVGSYQDPTLGTYEGFVTTGGKFTELIVPGSITTFANSINNGGIIVGSYFNGTVNPQGFMATPSE